MLSSNKKIIDKCKKCRHKNSIGIYPMSCKTCNPSSEKLTAQERKKRYRNLPEVKKRDRETFLNRYFKRIYGITHAQYNDLLLKQDGCCAICKSDKGRINPKTKKAENLSVDHCHLTGKVRGLLCTKCNHGIGIFKENIDLMKKAIEYLNMHNNDPK